MDGPFLMKKLIEERMLKVFQYASSIRNQKAHHKILKGLGLGRINRVRHLEDTPAIRGMIQKIPHLVKVID